MSETKAIGILNKAVNGKSLQFYDYDGDYSSAELKQILEIFPNDCIAYKSKNGTHFISFTLLNLTDSMKNAYELSKKLNQDYVVPNFLILRVSSKISENKIISHCPYFLKIIKEPRINTEISGSHLNFYRKVMKLPIEIYQLYRNKCICVKCNTSFKFYTTNKN
jgi:hypothetical protein